MMRLICLQRVVIAAFVAIGLSTPALAKTLDLEDLATPMSDDAGPLLPNASAALDEEGKKLFMEAIKAFADNDFPTAETRSRKLLEMAQNAPEAWYLLGLTLANLDRRDEAIEAIDRSASLYKQNAEPLVIKGELLLSLGRLEDAGAAWLAATQVDPTNWRGLERLAAYMESRGDKDGALRLYERSIADGDSERIYPRLQASRIALLLGLPERVVDLLGEIGKEENPPSLVLDYLARANVGLENLDEGKRLFDQLIARAESARPFIARARLAVGEGDLTGAAAMLAEAVGKFPGQPALLLEQGRVLGASGQYDLALAAFEAGLAVAPDDPALLRGASLAASRLQRDEAAIGYARSIVAQTVATSEDRIRLAALLEKGGSRDDAVTLYRTVLETEPENWVALNNLANLLAESTPNEAVALAEKAVALAPDVSTVKDTLGLAQLSAGELDRASATFEAMRVAEPTAALPLYRLALVRQEQGRAEEANRLLQDALALDPDFAYAEDAKRRLQ